MYTEPVPLKYEELDIRIFFYSVGGGGFVDANESRRTDVERENNWMSVEGLTLDESYWFQVTAQDAEGEQTSSEPRIFALRMRTGRQSSDDVFSCPSADYRR